MLSPLRHPPGLVGFIGWWAILMAKWLLLRAISPVTFLSKCYFDLDFYLWMRDRDIYQHLTEKHIVLLININQPQDNFVFVFVNVLPRTDRFFFPFPFSFIPIIFFPLLYRVIIENTNEPLNNFYLTISPSPPPFCFKILFFRGFFHFNLHFDFFHHWCKFLTVTIL